MVVVCREDDIMRAGSSGHLMMAGNATIVVANFIFTQTTAYT